MADRDLDVHIKVEEREGQREQGGYHSRLINDPVIKALSVKSNCSETVQLPVRIPAQVRNIYLKTVKE